MAPLRCPVGNTSAKNKLKSVPTREIKLNLAKLVVQLRVFMNI